VPEDAQKKPIRGYVSSYLKRPLDQAQQEQETQQIGDTSSEKAKKSKD
jgi:hypothetical protein